MIQLYFLKRGFDAQKAERWFKERRVQVQLVDLSHAKLGRRELESVKAQVGLRALIDEESKAWKECPARFAREEGVLMDALLADPRRLRLPIARNGKLATVGYAPEVWAEWIREDR